MSQLCIFKPNFSATSFASAMSLGLYVSFSGSINPSTRFPPIARLESAAVVLLSTPPDKPRTMPSAPEFSTYCLMNLLILFSVSDQSNSRTEGANFTLAHAPLMFYGCRQLFKDAHKYY